MCEDLDEELNPLDALPASSHETGPSDPLLAHDQQWETLQGGVMECQRAKDGWCYAETRIRWQGALAETVWHDDEACFNHMMPIDFWMDCLRWTNNSLSDNVAVSVGQNQAEYAARFIRNKCGQLNKVFELLCFAV